MSNHHAVVKTQAELAELFAQDLTSGVGRSVKHDSAAKHVSGEAQYIDDRLEFPNQLHLYARMSDRAHARILSIDTTPCYAFDGVRIAITHEDVPGLKDIGPLMPGDPLLAIDTVQFVGQVVLAVAARDLEILKKATDADGRPLEVHTVSPPRNPRKSKFSKGNPDFAAGYINYFVINGALIAPEFGDPVADRKALDLLARLYPDRKVVALNIDAIAAGGGGIHCVTSHQPCDHRIQGRYQGWPAPRQARRNARRNRHGRR